MAGKIPKYFIADLINRIDIIDVIDPRLPLKKKGRDYQACCPFHNEKTPSFTVSQNKQFYYCFGCGAKGNAIGFLMQYEQMDFVEAIETLADSISIEIPREEGNSNTHYQAPKNNFDAQYSTLEQCALFYQHALTKNDLAQQYTQQRHISDKTIERFGIGYAPKEWQSIPGDKQLLIQTGMSIASDKGHSYDRFRHRLMFPIRNRKGNTIAFGGRIIDPEDKPKYLNSPETEVFHKGEEIYGLYELRQMHSKIDFILVTEGYMDVVALSEHGIYCAVATLGTAINSKQIETLFRICNHLVFCFDGDNAGKKAAQRALENSFITMKENRIGKFLFLPDGEDPDTFVQKFGKQHLIHEIDNSITLIGFLFDYLLSKHNIKSVEGRAQINNEIRPHIEKIPFQSLKEQVKARFKKSNIQADKQLQKAFKEDTTTNPDLPSIKSNHRWSNSSLAINLLFQNPSLATSCSPNYQWSGSNIPGVPLLLEIIDAIQEDPEISPSNLLQHFDAHKFSEQLYKLAVMHPPESEQTESAEKMLNDCLYSIQQNFSLLRRKELIKKSSLGEALSNSEQKEMSLLLSQKK